MNLQTFLRSLEQFASQHDLPIIGSKKGLVLGDVVKHQRPRRILEVGTLIGYSAILMSQHLPSASTITTIEIDEQLAELARQNVRRADLVDRIEVVVGNALEVIPLLPGPYDLLFLDAAKEEYLAYLKAAEPKLSKKAVVVADNVKIFAEAMDDFLNYVRSSGEYESETHDLGFDAVEKSKRVG